jgi:hypothetical protein
MQKNQFGLTTTTSRGNGETDGKAIRFQMNADGTLSPADGERLDFAAWDALSDDQAQALYDDVRQGGLGWSYGKKDEA